MKLFKDKVFNIDFVKYRKFCFGVSLFLLALSLFAFLGKGLKYGIDFQGGTLVEVSSSAPIDIAKVRSDLGFLEDLSVQTSGGEGKTLLIQTKGIEGLTGAQVVEKIKQTLGPTYRSERVEVIGPRIGKELKTKSLLASIFALIAITIYIWVRFEWPFAVGCLVALAHDLVIVVGLFALLGFEFDMVVVAGLLSLAGYDCNDTIVTYDRIRENLKKYRKMEVNALLNQSNNETLSRTIFTSLTTLAVILTLVIFGGQTLYGFSMAMLFGTILGTYSSIFIAVPILSYFDIRSTGKTDKPLA